MWPRLAILPGVLLEERGWYPVLFVCDPGENELGVGAFDVTQLVEHDAMRCRACGNEERASEGYPCENCGTFICVICNMKGVTRCATCAGKSPPPTLPDAGAS